MSRWDPCIHHRDTQAHQFIASYFAAADRHCLLVCGAGFDPRATIAAEEVAKVAGDRLQGFFIREDRPDPDQSLLDRAQANEDALKAAVPRHGVHHIPIFSDDEKTVVAGRKIVALLHAHDLTGLTDIVVDLSALSIGASFPIVRYLFEQACARPKFPNVHLMVNTSPSVDSAVNSELTDKPQRVLGFGDEMGTDEGDRKPKLWLPQLGRRAVPALDMILGRMTFEEVCPILPFPASDARAVETLVEHYQSQIAESWLVDDRDFLYAAENDPLDLYRTILRIDALRRTAYAVEGGSITVLSPLGTKAMAIGALLAALERDLPVVYVETLRYKITSAAAAEPYGLIHLWLTGGVYPAATPPANG